VQEENNLPLDIENITLDSNTNISQIFDKILKRILMASSNASVVAFINGMFSENFPRDSEITYNYTENIDGSLKKTVADIIITLCSKDRVCRFHLEGQVNDDNTIVIRVFEYGFADALRHQTTHSNKITLPFPTPAIIFLEHTETTPDKVILELDFGENGKFDYAVKTMKFLTYSVEELCKKNMTILLPLYLLKLRREVDNAKKRKTQRKTTLRKIAKKLKSLIEESVLPAIAESESLGNITHSDAFELLSLLERLYDYLYGSIPEFREEEANIMLSNILELKYDSEFAGIKAKLAEFRSKYDALESEYTAKLAEAEAKFIETEAKFIEAKAKQEAKFIEAEAKQMEEKRIAARNFKNDGIPVEVISRNMGISIAEIENL